MKSKINKIIYTSLTLLLIGACSNNAPVKKTEQAVNIDIVSLNQAQFDRAGVKTDSLIYKSMAYVVKVSGKIDVPPQNMVSVSAPMGGFLKSTKLLPGMHINKGEVIAIMEDQQYIQLQHDYLTTGYELEFLEKEYQRQKELASNKAVSDKSYEQANSAYKTKRADRKALAEKLKLIGIDPGTLSEDNISPTVRIYSPIEGFVSQVKVNIGKYIQASEVLFDLVNPEDIHLNMTVFEKDLPFLSIGQKVKAYSNNAPDKIYPCEIILIGQDVSADRHVEVHCHFEKYDRSLIPGMYMNAEIETQAQNVYVLPTSSVLSFQGERYVFVSEGPLKFRMVKVEVGLSEGNRIEIINAGELKGKSVVVHGAYDLLMMLKNVEEEE